MKELSKDGGKPDYYRNFLWDAVVVFSLFSLSIVRPLFEVLAPNVEFFIFKRSSSLDIIIFVLALVFLVPSILVLLRYLLSRISETAGNFFQGIIVASLTLAYIIPGLNRHHWITNNTLVAILILVCGLIGLGYLFFKWIRLFYLYLAPAVLIVPLLFLFSPGVYRILFSMPFDIPSIQVQSNVPLVLIVFDEFPTISLLDENRQIDNVRYPNFAKLEREWTWYRNASSVATQTEDSVPAILTGLLPEKGRLPILTDHPRNLFSILQKSHRLEVFESLTRLNPQEVVSGKERGLIAGWRSVISDLWLIYLHIILPDRYLQNLQPVAQSWGDFGANTAKIAANRKSNYNEPTVLLSKFLSVLQPSEKPPFYFLHVKLPHAPWHLLPSGKDYGSRTFEGIIPQLWKWRNNEPIVQRAYQRHLLQIGYVDHWIGSLIKRLKETDLYDKSVIVIVADHGISFTKGADLRILSKENAEEIIFVPLFIKSPGQKKGKIIDWNVNTTDIFPTVTELMGFTVPWKLDGVSLENHPFPMERLRVVCDKKCQNHYSFDSKLCADGLALKRKLLWFGSGSWDRLFRFGPCSETIGKPVPPSAKPAQNITIALRNKELFTNVSLDSNLIPVFVAGTLKSDVPLLQQLGVGVSMNGIFQTTAFSLVQGPNTHTVDVIIPQSSIRPGYNQMQMYLFANCSEPGLIQEE